MSEGKNQQLQSWLETAVSGVRFRPDRVEVERELREHIEDKLAGLQRIYPDMTAQEAGAMALAQMGDPAEIGKELARIHKPWLGRLWEASKVLMGLLLAALIWCSVSMDYHDSHHIGGALWDWDNLPGDGSYNLMCGSPGIQSEGRTREDIYLPNSDPEQLMSREYQGEQDGFVNGQKVSLRRAALWQGREGRELFVYFRVESWRFWERGEPYPYWFSAVDSLGNQYDLNPEWEEDAEAENEIDLVHYGPFFQEWQVCLSKVDPAAEWVRLDYGPVEASFSLVVDLEETGR